MIWVEVVGLPGRDGVVADGRDLAAGATVEVEDATARRLVALGRARLIEPPVPVDRPAVQVRARTR